MAWTAKRLFAALLIASPVTAATAAGQVRRAPPPLPPPAVTSASQRVLLDTLPVVLPFVAPWGVILRGAAPAGSRPVPPAVAAAWLAYASGDHLGARVELSRRLPQVIASANVDAIAKALSLHVLTASGSYKESALTDSLDKAVPDWRTRAPSMSAWVSLFEGAYAFERRQTSVAAATWKAVVDSADAPPVARLLAQLGTVRTAIESGRASEALQLVDVMERELVDSTPERSRAAVAIARVQGLHAARRSDDADAAAVGALAFCQTRRLMDVIVEVELVAAESQANYRPAASRAAVERAEQAAVFAGAAGQPRLEETQLRRLHDFALAAPTVVGAREFDRWAATTGHTVVRVTAKRRLAEALAAAGEPGTGAWHAAIAGDLEAVTTARLPDCARWLSLLLLDYDLLTATRALERGAEPVTATNYLQLADAMLAFVRAAAMARVVPGNPKHEEGVRQLASGVEAQRLMARRLLAGGDRKAAAAAFRSFFEQLQELNNRLRFSDDDASGPDRRVVYVSNLIAAYLAQAPDDLAGAAAALGASGVAAREWFAFPHMLQRHPGGLPIGRALEVLGGAPDDTGRLVQDRPDVRARTIALRAILDAAPRDRTVAWPRVIVGRAASTVATQAAGIVLFGSSAASMGELEAAQFGLLHAGQLALAAGNDLRFVRPRSASAFDRFLPLLHEPGERADEAREELQALATFGMRYWLTGLAVPTSDEFVGRLLGIDEARTDGPPLRRLLRSAVWPAREPRFDVLDVDEDEAEVQLALIAWALEYPLLIGAIAYQSPDAAFVQPIGTEFAAAERRTRHIGAAIDPFLPTADQVRRLRIHTVLNGALVSLAVRNYRRAAEALAEAAALTAPQQSLELAQIHYLAAMCARGLNDVRGEEVALARAVDLLDAFRRALPTRNASLRLRELRQLLQDEYVSVLHRRAAPKRMAQAIARYRTASLIPAAVAAPGSSRQDAELATLRALYHAVATGNEASPVTRRDLQELLDAFKEKSDLPPGEPTLNAIADATDFVVDDMARGSPAATLLPVAARHARPGELIVMQLVGHEGVYLVTSDSQGERTRTTARSSVRHWRCCARISTPRSRQRLMQRRRPSGWHELLLRSLPELSGKRRISILRTARSRRWRGRRFAPAPKGPRSSRNSKSNCCPACRRTGCPPRRTTFPCGFLSSPTRTIGRDGRRTHVDASTHLVGSERTAFAISRPRPPPRLPSEVRWARDLLFATHAESNRVRPHYSFLELPRYRRAAREHLAVSSSPYRGVPQTPRAGLAPAG